MSRRCVGLLALGMVAIATIPPQGAQAQESTDRRTTEVMAKSRAAIGPISPEEQRKACRATTKEGEIVVCAPGDGKEFRVESSAQLNPNSRAATRTGVPRAPKFDGEACDTKKITCFGFGKTRKIELIDLASIPATPPGSDADKVGKGELRDR